MHCRRAVPECLQVVSAGGAESMILSAGGAESMMLSDTLSALALRELRACMIVSAPLAESMILSALFGRVSTLR